MKFSPNGTSNAVAGSRPVRKTYARTPTVLELPRLTEVQLRSFEWFKGEGLRELFEEISPIVSFNKNLELHLGDFHFGDPKYTEDECRDRDITFSAPLWVKIKLVNKDTGEISEQEVFMGDFPLMTESATFIINGSERVVVSQLIRSPGVYFTVEEDRSTGRDLAGAKLIPSRGAWLEFETSKRDIISVKVDRKRKLPVTLLLRAIGYGTDDEIRDLFKDIDIDADHPYIESTLERDSTSNNYENSEQGVDDALLEFYKKLRPGDPPTLDNAKSFVQNLFFSPRRYDLGRVGRYKLSRRLGVDTDLETRTLTNEDIVAVIRRIVLINLGQGRPDDIDHLGNRRIKTVGELIQNQIRIGLLRMERVVRERMSIRDPEQVTPLSLINIRPVVAATREFFGGSQLSQFMDQTNPLAELTHKRRLSALGPGGLRRERAGFDVRDVHFSHYGRICPIETPEGPNIGLIGSMASFARVNDFGFVETPYRRVFTFLPPVAEELVGHELRADVSDPSSDAVIAKKGDVIDTAMAQAIAKAFVDEPDAQIRVVAFAGRDVIYLTADEDEEATIAQASSELNAIGEFQNPRPSARRAESFIFAQPEQLRYMDVSPKQIVGVSAALIPFLEHDDANRALMGSNMQRQAVPLVKPDAPVVGTGMEWQAAIDSGQVLTARYPGEVVSVTGAEIVVQEEDGARRTYHMRKYNRSNQSTCIDQRPRVFKGDRVEEGSVLADSSSTEGGELALGQNVVVAYMSWEGGNYEDAILVSERLVQEDRYTSIHVEKHEVDARETKLGPEEITRDIPNVGEDALKDLDEEGVIRIGAEVTPGDILVGKITPK
ncbi:MAG: DNA-directed RNA polymerase subunit beta, partial [Caldilineaceae bacterium]|nr:DNA-directed RNA polymerase subunit beta [Caldilineaceae bacterium]